MQSLTSDIERTGAATLREGANARSRSAAEGRARALGWFSVGLGAAQLLAPGAIARGCGLRDGGGVRSIMRLLGLRELTAGAGLLTGSSRPGWLWGRFIGDIMDLALLGGALVSERRAANRGRLGAATLAVAGCALVDGLSAVQLSNVTGAGAARARLGAGTRDVGVTQTVVRAITVRRQPQEIYAFWRDFQNLPKFMAHLESVITHDGRSRWRAKAPIGDVEWEAQTIVDRPGELIAWRSVGRSDIAHEGSVTFRPAPADQGTEVRVELRYRAPGGRAGKLVAKLFGKEPGQQIAGDLRRLKQVLETGEVVHSDASIHEGMHAAWPARDVPRAQHQHEATVMS